MAQTTSADIAAAVTFKVQRKVLANLRGNLVFADEQFAEQGDFDPGTDSLLFTSYADLGTSTTPLVEGVGPTPRALSMSTVSVDTAQYGDAVQITDLAKLKSGNDLVAIASERISRQMKVVLDTLTRDAIASGGTAKYQAGDTTRAGLASTDLITLADLNKLAFQMEYANIPRFSDGFYVLWVAPGVAYDLFSDSAFTAVHQYTDNTPLIKGEVGKIAGFRVVIAHSAPTFSSTTTVFASIAVGDVKAWGMGSLATTEVFSLNQADKSDIVNQKHIMSWKSNYGVAPLNNGYYFRFESAATDLAA
jgi:N4-gp56 family major capsid protein